MTRPDLDLLVSIFPPPLCGATLPPDLVIAAALSTVRWSPGEMHGPDDRVVQLILSGLKMAGWKIVPIKEGANHD